MAGEDSEVCGFLDAKLPGCRYMSQRVRKRPLALWKAWRRHWCSIRKLGSGLGIEVHLDRGLSSDGINDRNNSIKIPADVIICRTESRTKQFAFSIFPAKERKPLLYLSGISESETQRWMANVRQLLKPRRHRFMEGTFNISMVDNSHSRASGLSGLYGDLVVCRSGLFFKDVHTGDIIENVDWMEMNDFHLVTAGRPEDVERICVIHTTKVFRGGTGELHIFCMNAGKLVQSLVTQGRGPRHKQLSRPLSLSEGDLRLSGIHVGRDEARQKLSPGKFPSFKSKVTATLISAGLCISLSSRSGSQVKLADELNGDRHDDDNLSAHLRAVDNVYQSKSGSLGVEEIDDSTVKRVSTLSLASGVYEEIQDDLKDFRKSVKVYSNLYEDPNEIFFMCDNTKRMPPPLPARQRCDSNGSIRTGSISDDGIDLDLVTLTAEEEHCQTITFDSSDYVPMSPIIQNTGTKTKNSEEDLYMVMR